MNLEATVIARKEAERFIVAAKEVERFTKENRMLFYGSPATGALRRASMDLTRALADLRRAT